MGGEESNPRPLPDSIGGEKLGSVSPDGDLVGGVLLAPCAFQLTQIGKRRSVSSARALGVQVGALGTTLLSPSMLDRPRALVPLEPKASLPDSENVGKRQGPTHFGSWFSGSSNTQ